MGVTDVDYLRQLQALLPSGPAWPRDDDATLTQLLHGLAVELARVDGRATQLLEEADPRTTVELFADWERVAGLPDACVTAFAGAQTTAQRRAALLGRLAALGAQTAAYFVAVAASLGYSITITEFRPFLAGGGRAGDAVTTSWQHAWRVNAQLNTVRTFRAGRSSAGEPLGAWGNDLLECTLKRLKPAHTTIIFSYT